jgi:hypothetical protein
MLPAVQCLVLKLQQVQGLCVAVGPAVERLEVAAAEASSARMAGASMYNSIGAGEGPTGVQLHQRLRVQQGLAVAGCTMQLLQQHQALVACTSALMLQFELS